MPDFIGAHTAGVPEGAMDQLGYNQSPFFKAQEDTFPSDDWYIYIHISYYYLQLHLCGAYICN